MLFSPTGMSRRVAVRGIKDSALCGGCSPTHTGTPPRQPPQVCQEGFAACGIGTLLYVGAASGALLCVCVLKPDLIHIKDYVFELI